MSLSESELIYLMAYVDGQVDDDELPDVMALLDKSEEARLIVAQHAALGDWVRTSRDAHAAEAGADRIAGRVLAEIENLGGGRVIEIERERARLTLNRQRVKEFSALAAVAAIAAAFLLMPARESPVAVRPAPEPTPHSSAGRAPISPPGGDTSAAVAATAPSASSEALAAAEPEPAEGEGVEVKSVESPEPFSIFYVPATTGLNAHSSSVVVWIDE